MLTRKFLHNLDIKFVAVSVSVLERVVLVKTDIFNIIN